MDDQDYFITINLENVNRPVIDRQNREEDSIEYLKDRKFTGEFGIYKLIKIYNSREVKTIEVEIKDIE